MTIKRKARKPYTALKVIFPDKRLEGKSGGFAANEIYYDSNGTTKGPS